MKWFMLCVMLTLAGCFSDQAFVEQTVAQHMAEWSQAREELKSLQIGWDYNQCRTILLKWKPDDINVTRNSNGESTQYVFRKYGVYIYFEGIYLSGIQF